MHCMAVLRRTRHVRRPGSTRPSPLRDTDLNKHISRLSIIRFVSTQDLLVDWTTPSPHSWSQRSRWISRVRRTVRARALLHPPRWLVASEVSSPCGKGTCVVWSLPHASPRPEAYETEDEGRKGSNALASRPIDMQCTSESGSEAPQQRERVRARVLGLGSGVRGAVPTAGQVRCGCW
jgi:hypothetical protein